MTMRDFDVVLVLGGGNALGAFQAGVYAALDAHGLHPDWVIGASIGAINGALILGSPVADRVATLRTFWRPGEGQPVVWLPGMTETGRRSAAVTWTLAAGRPGMFGPAAAWQAWSRQRPALFETDQLAVTLDRLVDFDRLNAGPGRLTATAVDVASAADVWMDSRERRIGSDHIRASAALPVLFPLVAIDGRWLVDGGLSANLPLDPLLSDPPRRPTLCIAVDLLPSVGPVPETLGEAASRAQDLAFAVQSRRTIARWQATHAGRTDICLSLVTLAYTDQAAEVAGKAFDFSGPTIDQRWSAGRQAGERLAGQVAAGSFTIAAAGFRVFGDGTD